MSAPSHDSALTDLNRVNAALQIAVRDEEIAAHRLALARIEKQRLTAELTAQTSSLLRASGVEEPQFKNYTFVRAEDGWITGIQQREPGA